MIQSSEAEAYFRRMLAEAGFSEQKPDPLLAWATFKAFSAVPVDCAGDDLLFQCGVYGFTGRERFHFGFVRQFTHYDDGEYEGMEQLDCTILFEPDPELRTLETNLWSSEFGSPAEFFAAVEALPEFQKAPRGRTPVGLELVHDEV